MDKTSTIKYILDNVGNLQVFDKLHLLRQMNKRKIKIIESADGSRIWLDRVSLCELRGIASYIRTIMDRDKEHFLTLD
jgi:uncharacterized protein with ATP-grasp and redox domains